MKHPFVIALLGSVAATLGAWGGGCAAKPELTAPQVLLSPYPSSAPPNTPLWAVAPLRNESGTTVADTMAMADELVAQLQQTRGLTAIPMNRVINAMRSLGMRDVATPADARTLAQALGVDALLVGSVTAWDPYDPPRVGLTLGLFGRGPTLVPGGEGGIDARDIQRSATERLPSRFDDRPLSVIVAHFDARNHETLMEVQRYAAGRTDTQSPLGWRTYTANMDQYTQFVAFQSLGELMDAERLRLARSAPAVKPQVKVSAAAR